MPTYCYRDERGNVGDRVFPIGKAPDCFIEDGEKFTRDVASEMESVSVPPTKGWPLVCLGSGVNAEQAGDLKKHLADRGVPTEVTPDGNPVYRNAKHRRKALKARGLVDKASYV